MNYITIGIGVVILGYGIFSLVMRIIKPQYFKKLEPMINTYGKVTGNLIHAISYIVVPLSLGVGAIYFGLLGVNPLTFFR